MRSVLEKARQRAADIILGSKYCPDATRLVELRQLQDQIAAIKNRSMFADSSNSMLAWVDDWRPKLDE